MGWLDKFKGKSKVSTPSEKGGQSRTSKILRVSDYLTAKNVAFFAAGPSKRQVLGSLIGSLDLPDPNGALKAILTREEAGSTVIAPGLALPHARISGLQRIVATIGVCATGVVDPKAGTNGPIHLFVLFLAPADNMKEHLAFLASVSALFQTDHLTERLATLSSPEAVIEAIKSAEKTQ